MAHLKLGSDFFDISIPPSFSLIGHSSSTVFLSMLVVFFSKNTLSQYILQFCGKDLVVVWLAQTFNLKIFKCTIKWKVYIEATNRTKKSFMSTAPLDSGSFDKKLQDPWVLLLRPSFSCGRNCRTLVQSNSVLPFFDKKFKKATQKYTPLFGILRPWLPWWETAGPLFKAIWSSFSLMGHSSSTTFLSMLVVFFVFKEQL